MRLPRSLPYIREASGRATAARTGPGLTLDSWRQLIGDEAVAVLHEHRAFVAGGAMCGLVRDIPFGDVDVFLRDATQVRVVVEALRRRCRGWIRESSLEGATNVSLFSGYWHHPLQIIGSPAVAGEPDAVLRMFDLTCVQGAFDFGHAPGVAAAVTLEAFWDDQMALTSPGLVKPLTTLLRAVKWTERGIIMPPDQWVTLAVALNGADAAALEQQSHYVRLVAARMLEALS